MKDWSDKEIEVVCIKSLDEIRPNVIPNKINKLKFTLGKLYSIKLRPYDENSFIWDGYHWVIDDYGSLRYVSIKIFKLLSEVRKAKLSKI